MVGLVDKFRTAAYAREADGMGKAFRVNTGSGGCLEIDQWRITFERNTWELIFGELLKIWQAVNIGSDRPNGTKVARGDYSFEQGHVEGG